MATTYLSRTSGAPTSAKKFTLSGWFKLNYSGTNTMQFFQTFHDISNREHLYFDDNKLKMYGVDGGSAAFNLVTNRLFTDINSYYHIVIACDTTQATASNRIKMYINGVQETSFSTETYPAQDFTFRLNTNSQSLVIGRYMGSNDYYYDGIISHLHFIDGTQYAASDFGSTDSTTGEWKINTSPSLTYGNNGFFILKDGNTITDQSSNTNNWTLTAGTLTKSEDNPSNIFCTGNPLARFSSNINYANGNNHITGSGNNWSMGAGTMGASSGKYYFECKILSAGTGSGYTKIGFVSDIGISPGATGGHPAETVLDGGYAFYQQNGNLEVRTDSAVISGYSNSDLGIALTNNDIMCLAVDMDNKKAYFRKNGDAWIKSANPVTGTNGLDISSDYPAGSTKMMIPAWGIYYPGTAALNFGNGYFGTTAVSSAGTNASNLGIFEFDVPTGYTALCTKGLNE
tara:strand:- start:173 stop:1543 length:1371 start_codon:yes stop_codon:yes gene_type:complete